MNSNAHYRFEQLRIRARRALRKAADAANTTLEPGVPTRSLERSNAYEVVVIARVMPYARRRSLDGNGYDAIQSYAVFGVVEADDHVVYLHEKISLDGKTGVNAGDFDADVNEAFRKADLGESL